MSERQAVESVGYRVESTILIPEGRSHDNFIVTLVDGSPMVARFEKPQTLNSADGVRRDFHFNGPLSLERERNLMELVRERGLPAPRVYGLYQNEHGSFLLVERLPGVYWSDFLAQSNYSLELYLRSLSYLGMDLALAHRAQFDSWGNVISRGLVNPGTFYNYPDRIRTTFETKLARAKQAESLSDEQLQRIDNHFQTELASLSQLMVGSKHKPVLILTDIHPMNFFVDTEGKPSGYFDLESCQAALPALEINMLRTTLLNYFEGFSQQAEAALLSGYKKNGGEYSSEDPVNKKIEHVLGIEYLIAAITLYYNASDGLRDTWSEQFKGIMFRAIDEGMIDYQAISAVYRSKTGQPRFPTL